MRAKILMLAFVLVLALGAVVISAQESRRASQEKPCIAQPSQNLGVAAITEGVGFIMAGGIGPIIMLVIAFVIGMLVSHAFWSTF